MWTMMCRGRNGIGSRKSSEATSLTIYRTPITVCGTGHLWQIMCVPHSLVWRISAQVKLLHLMRCWLSENIHIVTWEQH